MIVERRALRAAIAYVYHLMLSQKPASLSASELEMQWVESGIRRADLAVAMHEMQQRRLVDEHNLNGNRIYSVTLRGLKEYSSIRGGIFIRLANWLTLLRIKIRSLQGKRAQPRLRHRRASDRLISPRLHAQ